MSATPFSETEPSKHNASSSNPGFLERLSGTIGGMVVGVALCGLSFYILFTNEGRALRTANSLDEGLFQVVSLHPSSSVEQQNNNRLVHLSTKLRTSQPLYDPNYEVTVQAVKLKRQVEMYQWVEYHDSKEYQEDGETKTETTYTYNSEWKSELVNSRNFDKEIGHINPSAMAVETVTVLAPEVWAGPFVISKGLVEQINNFQTLSLKDFPTLDTESSFTVDEDYFYHTPHPHRPEVGDVRVSFSYAGLSGEESFLGPAQTDISTETLACHMLLAKKYRRVREHKKIQVSVVAMQKGETLIPFKTKSGDSLEILYLEELSAQEVFEKEHQHNNMLTWALRAGGWGLMFLGISMTIRIFHTLVDWIPVLRELISIGLKLFALCVSCSLSLLTIASGWLFYRPLVGVALAAMALLPVIIGRTQVPVKKNQ